MIKQNDCIEWWSKLKVEQLCKLLESISMVIYSACKFVASFSAGKASNEEDKAASPELSMESLTDTGTVQVASLSARHNSNNNNLVCSLLLQFQVFLCSILFET